MKVATRYLLPLEIFMALQMLSWGISGGFGGGYLWRTLEKTQQNTEWGLVLCLVGMAQFALAAIEWAIGRRWPNAHLHRSVSARLWIAFISFAVWVYLCFMVLTVFGAQVPMLALQAPAGGLFSLWVLAENMKVALILDPSVPTARLQRQLELERSH